MLSERFTDSLNGLVFPRKLFLLASSDEVKSINWAREGTTVEIHSIILCAECFHPKVFNVKSNQHVLRQLSYYKFEKLDQKKKLWEFKHQFFQAGRQDLLPLIKRTPQRVPKKFVKDVERRCSPRIRSMASRKRPQMYDAEADDDELGLGIDFKEPKLLLRKLKYEEDEYFPNYRCSYSSNATSEAQTSSNKNSALSNSNVAGRSKGKPKLKVEESNGCPPIKRKRGRPRKLPLPSGDVSKDPSSTKTEEKYEDVGMPSTSREYFVKTSTSPSTKLYHDCLNADWRQERLNFQDKNPIWGESNVYLPNYITENASLVGYPKKKTFRKRQDKNGMIQYSVSDDLFYHDMDMDRRISQVDMPYRSAKAQEETNQNNLPSTSAEKERPPILITVSRNEFRGNESGEILYGMNRGNCHNENRSGERLRSSNSTNVDGTQNQNYQGDEAKMNPTYENGTFRFPVDDVHGSQKVEYTNENFSMFNYMPQNCLESNSTWEMEQRSTEKPTTSLATSLSDTTAISPQQLSDFQGNKFLNNLDQVNFVPNIGAKVYNDTPQPSCLYTENSIKYPLPSYECFNANGLLTEFKNDPRVQENFIYNLTDLDDNREGKMNNLEDSSKVDQNRKISESCVVIPISNECPQQTPSTTPEHQFDSRSTTNSDHNYCLEKETDYTFVDSTMKPEFSEAILQSLRVPMSGNQDAVPHQLNFLASKYPADQNELVSPYSQFIETKCCQNGVVEMEQDSNINSSENFQSRQDSSVPTFEPKTESDIFDTDSHEIIDLVEKLDYNCSRLEDISEDLEILKQMGPLQNHIEAFLRTENPLYAEADEHLSNCFIPSDDPYIESSSNDFVQREGKPLRLIEFLGEQLQDGRIYTWDFMNTDLVIKDCAVDFIDWCSRKTAPRLNGLN